MLIHSSIAHPCFFKSVTLQKSDRLTQITKQSDMRFYFQRIILLNIFKKINVKMYELSVHKQFILTTLIKVMWNKFIAL